MDEKKCYSLDEVEEILGVGRKAVLKLLKTNEFRWFRIGNRYRISKKSFDSWIDEGAQSDSPEEAPEEKNEEISGAKIPEEGFSTWTI